MALALSQNCNGPSYGSPPARRAFVDRDRIDWDRLATAVRRRRIGPGAGARRSVGHDAGTQRGEFLDPGDGLARRRVFRDLDHANTSGESQPVGESLGSGGFDWRATANWRTACDPDSGRRFVGACARLDAFRIHAANIHAAIFRANAGTGYARPNGAHARGRCRSCAGPRSGRSGDAAASNPHAGPANARDALTSRALAERTTGVRR